MRDDVAAALLGKPLDGEHDLDVCTCDCHVTGAIHVVACCVQCPTCGLRVAREREESHRLRHRTHGRPLPRRKAGRGRA